MSRAVLAGLLVCACSPFTNPDPDGWSRVIGTVNPALSSIQMVNLPTEARVNVPFTVTVMTLGSSSCTRADGTDVDTAGLRVTIIPYDRVAPPGTPCTRDLRAFPHEVQLRFATAGEARITVVGRHEGSTVTHDLRIPVR
jgi:hypothetical protein